MKLFPNLVKSLVEGLNEIINEGRYADKVIEYMLKNNPKWGSRDRSFIAESTYEIIRHKRYLQTLGTINDLSEKENLWKIIGVYLSKKYDELPDWKEFEGIKIIDDSDFDRKTMQSYPDWMDSLLETQLGASLWNEEAIALNQAAQVVLRSNSLKNTRMNLKKALSNEGIETEIVDNQDDALVLTKRVNLFKLALFQEGKLEVQDGSSQLIAPFLELQPGQRVIDACAGAGGKSLHIAALMENKGKLISMDVEEFKLTELKRRARRAGVSIIETRVIENSKTIKRLSESADRVLLDVPCSGLGVLRRNPDAKWKLNPEFIDRVVLTQSEILQNYSKMVKKGGILVYATCSILPRENQNQIENFLTKNNDFELIEDKKIYASTHGFDGFYMAKLKRKI